MKVIRNASIKKVKSVRYEYRFKEDPSHGFFFESIDGNIIFRTEKARKNFRYCQKHLKEMDCEVTESEKKLEVPALGVCDGCGRILPASGFVRCLCGCIYEDGEEVNYENF